MVLETVNRHRRASHGRMIRLEVRQQSRHRWTRWLAMAALAAGIGPAAAAQGLPSEPLVFGHGRVTMGGEAWATVSCAPASDETACGEDTGFFNYSDYDRSTLRMIRVAVNASVRANRHFTFLTEIRSDNGDLPTPYALYARIRPWPARPFDLQVGRIPPTFGAFARRNYASDNLLIGFPMAYQYLTSLRTDAVPEGPDDLLQMRGRGWLSSFPLGHREPMHGLPLSTAFRWDTGVQAHVATPHVEATVALTNGSLGNPLFADDNGGKQVVGRFAARPVTGLAVGVSASRAPYLATELLRAIGQEALAGRFMQTAIGADAEYSRNYYLVRFETIVSRWSLPNVTPRLRAVSTMIEGRYKLRPGLFLAARLDHLGFNRITGTSTTDTWEAPVTRVEIGGGYLLRRNLELKLSVQRNVRDGGRVPQLTLGAARLGYWF